MEKINHTNDSYFSYGLNIKSFINLPGLIKTDAEENVFVIKGKVKESDFYKGYPQKNVIRRPELCIEIRASKEIFCIDWYNFGSCLIENGSKVIVEINNDIAQEEFIPFITGPILAILLHQRNFLVLHASAVEINGRVTIFLGNKGYGKSTLAAHLQSRGHKLVSDDLVPVRFTNGFAETFPGHPQIRLFPDSVQSIGLNPSSLPLVNTWMSKRFLGVNDKFSIKPVKLGHIYVLTEDEEISISELNPSSAFVEIARNNYMKSYVEATDNTLQNFQNCQKLTKTVPTYQLKRPHDYNQIQKLTEQIEQHVFEIS